jgi:hypothetical protein
MKNIVKYVRGAASKNRENFQSVLKAIELTIEPGASRIRSRSVNYSGLN